jgi:hypothetical protein
MPIHDLKSAVSRYVQVSRTIAAHSHRNPGRVLVRSLWARFAYGLGVQDFWLFNLDAKEPRQWREYLTKNAMNALQAPVNPARHKELVTNKLLFHERCASCGISTPPILGVVLYQEKLPLPKGIPAAKTGGELKEMLLKYEGQQLIFKDVRGAWGQGVLLVQIRGGRIIDHNNNDLPPESIFKHCARYESSFLIQEFLSTDERLKPIMPGPALGTIRVVTILDGARGDVLVPYAFVKITTSGNITDNFYHGSTGNLLGGIDISSGRIMCAWGMSDPQPGCLVQVQRHPNTGTDLPGFPLPEWQQILAAVRHAATRFPELRTLGWDVAITTKGICLLEANCNYDPDGPQITLDRGVRSEISALYNSAMAGLDELKDKEAVRQSSLEQS